MMTEMLLTELIALSGEDNVIKNARLSDYTTFKTGGNCFALVSPETPDKLKEIISFLKKTETPFFVIGRGSNLLVSDKGYAGVVISLRKHFYKIKTGGNRISAESGAMLFEVAREAMKQGLKGLEFASGIPGTVGGAVYMNAGAYDEDMSMRVEKATLLFDNGDIKEIGNEEMGFSYRHSALSLKNAIVLNVTFLLEKGNTAEIREKTELLSLKRREKQPLEYPSAGSTFKRPEGFFAGKLIEEAGLKGYSIGDACVSVKHAGFIINKGSATSEDIYRLIIHVKETVYARFLVELEPEIKFIGEFL